MTSGVEQFWGADLIAAASLQPNLPSSRGITSIGA